MEGTLIIDTQVLHFRPWVTAASIGNLKIPSCKCRRRWKGNREIRNRLCTGGTAIPLDSFREGSENHEMSVLLRHLLSLAVLGCPISCMGASGSGGFDEVGRTVQSCTCCGLDTAANNSGPTSCPPLPGKKCECGACFCNGAVVVEGYELFSLRDDGSKSWSGSPHFAPLVAPSFSATIANTRETSPAASASGRAARILHQSFLI